jgi:protease stability complex PrcB-like protein
VPATPIFTEPARLVIRSQEEWASAWALIQGSAAASPLPPVDFGADMVVVAATGTRRSGGYDIIIPDAALDAGTLRVGVVETTPGSGCAVETVLTSPVAAARVPRHDGPVEFVDETVAVACQ